MGEAKQARNICWVVYASGLRKGFLIFIKGSFTRLFVGVSRPLQQIFEWMAKELKIKCICILFWYKIEDSSSETQFSHIVLINGPVSPKTWVCVFGWTAGSSDLGTWDLALSCACAWHNVPKTHSKIHKVHRDHKSRK